MKEKVSRSEIRGLNREYFYFLVEETFASKDLSSPSTKQIEAAINKLSGLMKQVLDASFNLIDPQKVAAEFNLSVLEIRQLYCQALTEVVFLLEKQAESKEVGFNENY